MKVISNKLLMAKTMETDNSKINFKIKISNRKRKNREVVINSQIEIIKIEMGMNNQEGMENKKF